MSNHPWRLLLRCRSATQQLHIPRHFSSSLSHPTPHPHFSSLLQARTHNVSQIPDLKSPSFRCFSTSELAIDDKDSDHAVLLTDIFSKSHRTSDEIKDELGSSGVVITSDLVLKVLQSPSTTPEVARSLFDWVSENAVEQLSPPCYNWMLGILGSNGNVKDFWDLVGIMQKKGYGVAKGAHTRALEKFEKEGLSNDVEELNKLYAASGSIDNSVEKLCSEVIRRNVWGDEVEKTLLDMKIPFSSDLVVMILENLGSEPNKALIFFRWIQGCKLLKHDGRTYNAMAKVLAREDSIDKFWRVADEMKGLGYELERTTYVESLQRFMRRNMIKDAVDLYVYTMAGTNNLSVHDCIYLLKKVVVSKELDMDLFLRVVKAYTEVGNVLKSSNVAAVLKSLTSVGRLGESNKILKAMEKGGYLPSDHIKSKVAFQLGRIGEKEEANEFMIKMEASPPESSYKGWTSLVEGYCAAGDIDEATSCFRKMVEKEGAHRAGHALDLLVKKYCRVHRSVDAAKFLVSEKELKPWHSTFKVLISQLLDGGGLEGFREALCLLRVMKNQGFPPFIDPFVEYVSRAGTADEAMMFLNAMTVKNFPSTNVFLRVFEAYFKAKRHSEAQDLLSLCPRFIRNHADVLNLFFTNSPQAATEQPQAASTDTLVAA